MGTPSRHTLGQGFQAKISSPSEEGVSSFPQLEHSSGQVGERTISPHASPHSWLEAQSHLPGCLPRAQVVLASQEASQGRPEPGPRKEYDETTGSWGGQDPSPSVNTP